MDTETLYSKIEWLRQHEAWAHNLWDKGVAAGYQDATHMAVQNARGTYSSLVNEEAMEKLRAQEKANVPMGSVNLHYPDITIFEVYKTAYDTGYYNATIEFDKANPMAAAQLAAINAAHRLNNDYNKGFAIGWTNGALAVIDHPDCFKDGEERQNLADIRDGAIGPEGAAELQRYYQRRFDKKR